MSLEKIKKEIASTNILKKHGKMLLNNYDLCIAIPYGKKCLVWLKEIDNKGHCLVCLLDGERNIVKVEKKLLSFNNVLCSNFGTILFCTILNDNFKNIIIEDIYYYKGLFVQESKYSDKLNSYKILFEEELEEHMYNEINLKLVAIKHTLDELKKEMLNIPYDIYSVKYVELKSNRVKTLISKNIPELNRLKLNFIVNKPDKTELYELYTLDKNFEVFYENMYIKTLEQSNLMKKIFSEEDKEKTTIECIHDKKRGWTPNKEVYNKRIANIGDIKHL